jgi:hypothetical protein
MPAGFKIGSKLTTFRTTARLFRRVYLFHHRIPIWVGRAGFKWLILYRFFLPYPDLSSQVLVLVLGGGVVLITTNACFYSVPYTLHSTLIYRNDGATNLPWKRYVPHTTRLSSAITTTWRDRRMGRPSSASCGHFKGVLWIVDPAPHIELRIRPRSAREILTIEDPDHK